MYGVIIEWLEQLPDQELCRLKDLVYDDNCHLATFAMKSSCKMQSKVANFFNEQVQKSIYKQGKESKI